MATLPWLRTCSRAFKAHRLGRAGWFLEVHREGLRLVSAELPTRPWVPLDLEQEYGGLSR